MARRVSKLVYKFDELSDSAKEKARDWFREGDDFDAEFVLEDANTIADILGIRIKTHQVPLHSGKTRSEPAIEYSGFCSQGSGACFTGNYEWKDGCQQAIREHAPQDTELHLIADTLAEYQLPYGFRLEAVIRKIGGGGNYSHSHTVTSDAAISESEEPVEMEQAVAFNPAIKATLVMQALTDTLPDEVSEEDDKALTDVLRDFMDWIYKQLDKENTYRYSAEYVDDAITSNDYEFDEDGSAA